MTSAGSTGQRHGSFVRASRPGACSAIPLLLVGALLSACGDGPTPTSVAGVRTLELEDPQGRNLPVDVWYPADPASATSPAAELVLQAIYLVPGVRDAPVAPGGPRPLVMLSHGSGGGRGDQAWLARRLAEAGFLVAAVEHPGNRLGDDSPDGVVTVWRRPPVVTFVLDRLLQDPDLGPRIDAARIGAAGHSSGGYTVIALAGAIYDFARMGAYCAGPDAGSDCSLADGLDIAAIGDLADAGRSFRDDRIRAAFAMAPAVGRGFSAEALGAVEIPVHVVGSTDDELTPFDQNAARYAQLLPNAELTVVQPGGHFVYLSSCNDLGREVATIVCDDPDPDTHRRGVHDFVARQAVEFFRERLDGAAVEP